MDDQPKRLGPKGPRLDYDRETPAYRVIYGAFGNLTDFCNATGIPLGTAHRWLVTNGIIPPHRQHPITEAAKAAGVDFDVALFVPTKPVTWKRGNNRKAA